MLGYDYDVNLLVLPGQGIILCCEHFQLDGSSPGCDYKEHHSLRSMTRGNQRELARQKNLKKQADQKKGREVPDGMNLTAIKTLYHPMT